jgi:hypothetical protein
MHEYKESGNTTACHLSVPDGTNTPRQLINAQGEITLSSCCTPWGDSLEIVGTGKHSTGAGQAFTFGCLGGVLDATTGLISVEIQAVS